MIIANIQITAIVYKMTLSSVSCEASVCCISHLCDYTQRTGPCKPVWAYSITPLDKAVFNVDFPTHLARLCKT